MIISNEDKSLMHFECELTKELTSVLKYHNRHFYVYIYGISIKSDLYVDKVLALRVPGCTIGAIILNDDLTIKEIKIYEDCSFKFKENTENIIKKYIHEEIQLKEGD